MEARPSPTRRAPRWRRRKQARPGEITAAALDFFVERGFESSRLEDIARMAGCTKGTIFLYYPSKAELFKATVREAMGPVLLAAEQAVEGHRGTARELLEQLLRRRWDALTNTRLSGIPKLMFSEAAKFPELARFYHDELIERGHNLLRRVLELGVANGEFRSDIDAANVARVAVAPILLAALWRHSFEAVAEPRIEPGPFLETSLTLLFQGIAANPQES